MGSRGTRTYENNGAAPMQRSLTPEPAPSSPGMAPRTAPSYGTPAAAGGGSFFQRHPFMTGIVGGLFGSWLGGMMFSHSGYAADVGSSSMGSGFGSLLQIVLIGFAIWFLVRLFRRRAAGGGNGMGFMPNSVGAAAAPVQQYRGQDINVTDADLNAFQTIHAQVQEAWSAGDLGRMRRIMTPEMISYFSEELTRNSSQGIQNVVANVHLLKGDLKESWEEADMQYATALMQWSAVDYVTRLGSPDTIVSGDPRTPVEASEVWTFVRRRGGEWLLSAVQQV